MLVCVGMAMGACGGPVDRTGAPTVSSAADAIVVTSPAFADGATIPAQFTCHGAGGSPPLAWAGLPAGTESVAVVVEDPDAPGGTFVHWVLWGLPPDLGELATGTVPAGAVQARNSGGSVGWTPPCPPSGTHRYRFTVFAEGSGVDLPEGADPVTAVRAVQEAAVAADTLTGTVSAG